MSPSINPKDTFDKDELVEIFSIDNESISKESISLEKAYFNFCLKGISRMVHKDDYPYKMVEYPNHQANKNV